jgi:hypothetical protein
MANKTKDGDKKMRRDRRLTHNSRRDATGARGAVRGPFRFAVLGLATALLVAACGGGGGARVGEHWHAAVRISVCGELYAEPPTSGGVHSHGDGLMHIHPRQGVSGESGENASVRTFFSGARILLTESSIQIPGDRLYRQGDRCPDGSAGNLVVTVNDEQVVDFLDYTPQDNDLVNIEFG